MRKLLISLAVLYKGDFFKIRKALKRKEKFYLETLPKAVSIIDSEYPKQLLQLKYPPYVLFYEGDISLLQRRMISIVGSRSSRPYGEAVTSMIVGCLNESFVMVSGMARGIDAIVHSQAQRSVGVIGCGLDIHYPRENEALYDKMFRSQLIISEYPESVLPHRQHFPFRNRIIAALGESLIVTQAARRSGTMLTVNEALNLGKEVYTVPYRLDEPEGAGCNLLLQQGANMIISQ